MSGPEYLFELAKKFGVVQVSCMSANERNEEIYKVTYAGGYFMGTEDEIRNQVAAFNAYNKYNDLFEKKDP